MFDWFRRLLRRFKPDTMEADLKVQRVEPTTIEGSLTVHVADERERPKVDPFARITAQHRVEAARREQRKPIGARTGPGMRRLRRHRSGRVYEAQSGVDHNRRPEDVDEEEPGKRKHSRRWRGLRTQ